MFLTIILPLLTPSLLYIAWLLMRGQAAPNAGDGQEGGVVRRLGDDMPWVTLVLSGAGLALAATMTMYLLQPMGSPTSEYSPPRMENGRIIPAELRDRDADAPDASGSADALPD
ncbi:hypothetical protein [Rhodospira trueperi]|uniref:hypothetical protein n=1 Tax=Rhodospira trueperi TaxID=69960 RepID=UPI00115FB766|nr:hypothetical protein [Rhodospira trueperi]